MNIPNKNELTRIYGEAEKSAARFQAVADHFAEIYHHDTAEFFTAPGRTEIIGNHTDHNGGRVIAVGTTSCRTLESATGEDGVLKSGSGWTEIFIYPGYKFKMIDGLITNFHLPESTLVMLVSALAGKENILHAYEVAVQEKYRFFSFGDAMFIQ